MLLLKVMLRRQRTRSHTRRTKISRLCQLPLLLLLLVLMEVGSSS
jgi:hypothetical protein